MDECQNASLHDCSPNANCTNLDGTFACNCLPEFTGNGITCTGMSWKKVLASPINLKSAQTLMNVLKTPCPALTPTASTSLVAILVDLAIQDFLEAIVAVIIALTAVS